MADDPNAPEQLSPSKLAAENAYRKRKGLPPIDAFGNVIANAAGLAAAPPAASTPAPTATPTPTPVAPAAAPPAAAAAAADLGPPPEGVEPLSPSRLASENARRKKLGQPLIDATDAPSARHRQLRLRRLRRELLRRLLLRRLPLHLPRRRLLRRPRLRPRASNP